MSEHDNELGHKTFFFDDEHRREKLDFGLRLAAHMATEVMSSIWHRVKATTKTSLIDDRSRG